MVLKLWFIEVVKPKLPCFWKAENMLYVIVNVDRNLEGTKRSVQHEKCSIIWLINPSKILEPLDKCKATFMLENWTLVYVYSWKNDETLRL